MAGLGNEQSLVKLSEANTNQYQTLFDGFSEDHNGLHVVQGDLDLAPYADADRKATAMYAKMDHTQVEDYMTR